MINFPDFYQEQEPYSPATQEADFFGEVKDLEGLLARVKEFPGYAKLSFERQEETREKIKEAYKNPKLVEEYFGNGSLSQALQRIINFRNN